MFANLLRDPNRRQLGMQLQPIALAANVRIVGRQRAKRWKNRYVVARKSADEYHEMLELDPDGNGSIRA